MAAFLGYLAGPIQGRLKPGRGPQGGDPRTTLAALVASFFSIDKKTSHSSATASLSSRMCFAVAPGEEGEAAQILEIGTRQH